jgi:hypothetical protein
MMTTENELIETIQKLREEKFPDLPKELVTEILKIESEFVEDRNEAFNRISHIVEDYLDTNEG